MGSAIVKFTFVANQCVPFHAHSLTERPLGGTETAVIRLGEALSARGHDLTIYTPHHDPAPSAVRYIHLSDQNLSNMAVCDVLVAVREWKILMSPAHADLRFFWTGDSYDAPATFGIGDPRVERRIDGLLLNSRWHRQELCNRAGVPFDKAWIIGCGVHMPHFRGCEPRGRKRLIYSSAPIRGLALLPRIYERVQAKHPDAKLHVFAGFDTYRDGLGPNLPNWENDWRTLAETLQRMPGCIVHGNILQEELAREFKKSAILVYPNTFNETFCVTAAEAQAAGCAIVTSDRAALPETVGKAGIMVSGLPGSTAYENAFVHAVDQLLSDDALFRTVTDRGRARAHEDFDWNVIAGRFEEHAVTMLERKKLSRRATRGTGATGVHLTSIKSATLSPGS